MSFLFFDTETTGLPDTKRPAGWEGQPHICQLGAILTEDDGAVKAEVNLLVRPDGWMGIPLQLSDIHGIFHEDAMRFGLSARGVISIFDRLCGMADTLVAHNLKFDQFMIEREAAAAKLHVHFPPGRFCTMEESKDLVQLAPTAKMLSAGIDGFKSPSLQEAYSHFFDRKFDGAHDAMADVRACSSVFFMLQKAKAKAA